MSASVIAVAGLYLLIALLNSMRPAFNLELFPGRFLYISFLEAAFYLPLLFLVSSVLLFADYYNPRIFSAKLFSLLPFFTFSLLLRVLNYVPGSPAADRIITSLGVRGSSLVLGLILIPEVLILLRILYKRSAKEVKRTSSFADQHVRRIKNEKSEYADEYADSELDPVIHSDVQSESEYVENEPDHRFEPVSLDFGSGIVSRLGTAEKTRTEKHEVDLFAAGDSGYGEIGDLPDADDSENFEAELLEELESHDDPEIEEISLEAEDPSALPAEPLDFYEDDSMIEDADDELPSVEKHLEEDYYPDAPVRGDEEEISRAAREVWSDAEQLGFEDLMSEDFQPAASREVVIEDADEWSSDEQSDDEQSDDEHDDNMDDFSGLSLDIDFREGQLDIPDMLEEPAEDIEPGMFGSDEDDDDFEDSDDDEYEDPEDPDDDEDEEPDFLEVEDSAADEDIVDNPETAFPVPAPSVQPKKPRKPKKYSVPVDNLLHQYEDDNYWIIDDETKAAAEILRETLEEFRIAAEVTGISKGPVITMFEILPAPGVKLSKIVNLADNIALRLAASRVRIVAPIPGKHAVGIEVPNKDRAIVSFKEILDSEDLKKSRMDIPVVLGKDITGGARIIDLVQTPHLLIAGATGSGKSVCVNSLICSVLYARTPEEVKMILIDPKIVELKMYNDIPHLLTPVITEPKKAFQSLQYATCEMERRYTLLNALGVRDVKSYNRKVKDLNLATDTLPYIVIIVDEFADLMATTGKELENVISRLAAMSRAVGIHLVLATQRPSVDVITGLIKANIPSRIAFMVASKTDSRIILDSMGADKLLGKGDMLFTSAWDPNPIRIQGAFLADDEVERVTDHVKTLGEPEYIDDEIFLPDGDDGDFELESLAGGDPLMEPAVQIVVDAGKASASYLQRRLKIGYNRAARLVEEMEERGIVGPANGSKPRDIIHIPDRV